MSINEPATPPCPSFVSRPGEFAAGPDSICATCAESGAAHGVTSYGPPTQIAREIERLSRDAARYPADMLKPDRPRDDRALQLLGQAAALLIENLEGPDDYHQLTEHLRTVAAERWHVAATDWVKRYHEWMSRDE